MYVIFGPTYKKTPEFTPQSNVHRKITYLLAVPDIVRYFGSRLYIKSRGLVQKKNYTMNECQQDPAGTTCTCFTELCNSNFGLAIDMKMPLIIFGAVLIIFVK
jgi:hypothetical protein